MSPSTSSPARRLPGPLVPTVLAAALWLVAPLGSAPLPAQGREDVQTDRSVLMRKKLDHAQRILGGLTEGRFGPIAGSARSLRELSEEAVWYSLPTDDYRRYSEEFRRLTASLAEQAEAEDLDAATLSYVRLTINCVECHKYVRIRTAPPDPPR
ncbi:hypothetical protein [Tautonia plasticadhaerens]|uniref:Cytochrome C n=1 Tax=Tautonia plasticadhaerens TaxID=2527974 RepID=A0A518GW96_9BACT|nr:hypothetical protein [Tautonia plasticadhaerens]QDV32811.1 hypothetical protein ElP_06510 [Tautonia plasticadhaerens]